VLRNTLGQTRFKLDQAKVCPFTTLVPLFFLLPFVISIYLIFFISLKFKKNLTSVKQFARDNPILLTSPTKNGLYHMPRSVSSSTSPQAFFFFFFFFVSELAFINGIICLVIKLFKWFVGSSPNFFFFNLIKLCVFILRAKQ
jgi:hypothetical protein